eukprot:CAMPEP_0185800052 /NCGR_PEP_ID=MMETSP1322-20130828/668_1 /TAXON_ID=265543 /ORGANISM="Minutocellus polymorphus, Strain RCC2270" /LENGTH=395 /DNA_ID=CAMNT_0028495669 /DNA_START=201 /DNA_END=1388 /DNA_ORIENTATION=+
MQLTTSALSLAIVVGLATTTTNAFVVPSTSTATTLAINGPSARSSSATASTTTRSKTFSPLTPLNMATDADDEIERLRSMAANLRAEASALEAEKVQALADAAQKAFDRFDTDKDGEISLAELKQGLEKSLKIELSDKRVKELMDAFDASGDGALQIDEMVTINLFRNKLESLVREEKRLAVEAKQKAEEEEKQAALAAARLEILNEKEPTTSDRFVSILPYLFPLMDGLAYGRFLLSTEDAAANPAVVFLAVLYGLYRAVPFSGFIAFFALNFLAGTPSINRLIRYNMQQAIFVDIALFFPGLAGGLLGALNLNFPTAIQELSTDAIFVTLLAVLGYCTVSSLFGVAPDKLPLISNSVNDRMPTIDMFDDSGSFIPRQLRQEEGDEDTDKKDDK